MGAPCNYLIFGPVSAYHYLFVMRHLSLDNVGKPNEKETMHTLFKEVNIEDAQRVLHYCRTHNIQNGGLFEVYSTPGEDIHMIIVNSCPEGEPLDHFRPLGAFYLNYLGHGSISLEENDPNYDGMAAREYHVKAIKQVINLLLKYGRPGYKLSYNDLPAIPKN